MSRQRMSFIVILPVCLGLMLSAKFIPAIIFLGAWLIGTVCCIDAACRTFPTLKAAYIEVLAGFMAMMAGVFLFSGLYWLGGVLIFGGWFMLVWGGASIYRCMFLLVRENKRR